MEKTYKLIHTVGRQLVPVEDQPNAPEWIHSLTEADGSGCDIYHNNDNDTYFAIDHNDGTQYELTADEVKDMTADDPAGRVITVRMPFYKAVLLI